MKSSHLALCAAFVALARAVNDCSHITCRHEVHRCTAFSFDTRASDACHTQWQACKQHKCWRDHSSEAYKNLFECDDAYRVAQGGWNAPKHSTIVHQVMVAHTTGTVDGFADECDGKKSHSSIRVFHHKDEATCSQDGLAGGHRCGMGLLSGDKSLCECGTFHAKPDLVYTFRGAAANGEAQVGGLGPVLYAGHDGAHLEVLNISVAGLLPPHGTVRDVAAQITRFRYRLSDGTLFGSGDDALGTPQVRHWTVDSEGRLAGSAYVRVVFTPSDNVEGMIPSFMGSKATSFIVDSRNCGAGDGSAVCPTVHSSFGAAAGRLTTSLSSFAISITNGACSTDLSAVPGSDCSSGANEVPMQLAS